MTIDESKTVLTTHREHWEYLLSEGICDESEGRKTIDAFTMAIASLEAWDKIRQDIQTETDDKSNNMYFNLGMLGALAIVNKHLQERSDKE